MIPTCLKLGELGTLHVHLWKDFNGNGDVDALLNHLERQNPQGKRTLANNIDIQSHGIPQLLGDSGWKPQKISSPLKAEAEIPRRKKFLREGDQGLGSLI